MQPFTVHEGVAAPLRMPNIDTDAIIPSREMKLVSKHGLGEGLFAGWRYQTPGARAPVADFVLNQAAYQNTSILLAGDNFGCGSSREHAVWALAEFGIRAIIAPGFGSIFQTNCIRNGLLPVICAESDVAALAAYVMLDPQAHRICVDLRRCELSSGELHIGFEMAQQERDMLLQGLDPIAMTLQRKHRIAEFEREDRQRRPWVYPD
jgi:3-isopropylmalate/(R)-2-methylmalate dehydratase small subunit